MESCTSLLPPVLPSNPLVHLRTGDSLFLPGLPPPERVQMGVPGSPFRTSRAAGSGWIRLAFALNTPETSARVGLVLLHLSPTPLPLHSSSLPAGPALLRIDTLYLAGSDEPHSPNQYATIAGKGPLGQITPPSQARWSQHSKGSHTPPQSELKLH